jgi:feruloyl esterase
LREESRVKTTNGGNAARAGAVPPHRATGRSASAAGVTRSAATLSIVLLALGCSTAWARTAAAVHAAIHTPAVACEQLAAQLAFPDTTIDSVSLDKGGRRNSQFPDAGPAPENCVVEGTIDAYTSAYTNPDSHSNQYGTRFELRMPTQWNGRFFYQGGEADDGYVAAAWGMVLSTLGQPTPQIPALWRGFAVVTSNGGHENSLRSEHDAQWAVKREAFGIDPRARITDAYASIGQVTPVAKQIVAQYYGEKPAYAYFVGCSKGGQEAMEASQRYGDQFDGIAAGDPGLHLPRVAIAAAWNTQALAAVAHASHPWATGASGHPLLYKAFTPSDLDLVQKGVLQACDALDGASDNMIFNAAACAGKFDPSSLQCAGRKLRSCLSADQVTALHKIFGGPKASDGSALYNSFPYDTDMSSYNGWIRFELGSPWGFNNAFNTTMEQEAAAYIFSTPPDPALDMFTVDIDQLAQSITATSGDYTVAAVDFMDSDSTDLDTFRNRGGKIIYYHGGSDPDFSANDTVDYYKALSAAYGGATPDFARLYLVPGMNHCFGGDYATDYFDVLAPLVDWVESGKAPDSIAAQPSHPQSSKLPAGTSRPLCAYPSYARYSGSGAVTDAASFSCANP